MYYKVNSGIMLGMNAHLIDVESDVCDGMPTFELVGYLSNEVKEAKERVRTALKNSGYLLPAQKITINISPGNLRKTGTGFDLPIALSILGCMGIIKPEDLGGTICLGELGLNGEIRAITGVLPRVIMAKEAGFVRAIVPERNAREGAVVEGIEVIGVNTLNQTIAYIKKEEKIESLKMDISTLLASEKESEDYVDFADIKGQKVVKRGMEIAAAGLHNIIMIGPPGVGKTMSAKALPSILPKLSIEECLNISKIYSVAGLLNESGIKLSRPFVNPHHSSSMHAIAGGGAIPKPGAVTLANKGVLFLDELPEFKREALEVLRQPLEDKEIVLSRANATYTYPADFLLACAANICPCSATERSKCICSPLQIKNYQGKISGPLMDRIDICVKTQDIKYTELLKESQKSESSKAIRERVLMARQRQNFRFRDEEIETNSHMSSGMIEKYCKIGASEQKLLGEVFEKLKLSARYYHKIIKTARTIADLEDKDDITESHIYEAIGYKFVSWRDYV